MKNHDIFTKFNLALTVLLVFVLLMSSWVYWGVGFKVLLPDAYNSVHSIVQAVPVTRNDDAPDLSLSELIDKYIMAKAWVCNESNISAEKLAKISCHLRF